jgi:hypothetical protein
VEEWLSDEEAAVKREEKRRYRNVLGWTISHGDGGGRSSVARIEPILIAVWSAIKARL